VLVDGKLGLETQPKSAPVKGGAPLPIPAR